MRPTRSCRPKACTRLSMDSLTLRSKPEYAWKMYHRNRSLTGGARSPAVPAARLPLVDGLLCFVCHSSSLSARIRYWPPIFVKHRMQYHIRRSHPRQRKKPEEKDGDDDDPGGRLHLLARGRNHFVHFRANFLKEVGEAVPRASNFIEHIRTRPRPLPSDWTGLSSPLTITFAIHCFLLRSCFRCARLLLQALAGAEGFEPPSPVLETSSLTVELTPLNSASSKSRSSA